MLHVELSEWNQTDVFYPRDSTITEQFEEQAFRTPEATAIIAEDEQLTYGELDERSNRLARHLASLGVKPETLVGVAVERSAQMVVSLLAVLKAGAAYVPLDPSHPQARLSTIIEDSGLAKIITTERMRGRLPVAANRFVVLDSERAEIACHSAHAIEPAASAGNLAYVIYTSGSTGRPKGVMVEHRNVVNFFTGMDLAIGSGPGVWLAVTSISFDISVLELLWTLTRGFQVVIHAGQSTDTIAAEIARHGVTHMQLTPSLARMLAMDPRSFLALGQLRQLLLGGEALPASLADKLSTVCKGQIYNMYGPTETTIWSTTHRVTGLAAAVSIGRPIANTRAYILDEKLNPVPDGAAGELFIGGEGVARGYWNRPDLTAERFLPDPFLPEERIYRTGDRARFSADGNLIYLGRTDFQIKLHGFRIEPGEIEAILEQQPGVKQAAVVLREDRPDDKRLVAYLVGVGDEEVSAGNLRRGLALRLPEHMMPSSFVFLKRLPLTDNLKLDRGALLRMPPPNQASPNGALPSHGTGIEGVIAGVLEEVLGISSVSLDANFLDLGADSLRIAEARAKLQEGLDREIPLVDLFEFPTVRALALHLGGVEARRPISDRARRRLASRER